MPDSGYVLGVDLGTTYSAAAIGRGDRVEMVSLDHASVAVPSVVWVAGDGETLIGSPAVRNLSVEPERGARLFKRRFGDDVPMYLGGVPHSPEELTRLLLTEVVDRVQRQEGHRPTTAVLTHPAAWGGFRLELLTSVARAAGLSEVTLLPEPVAAAVDYAGRERVGAGELLAVYDLGGGTFDTAVLRASDDGFEVIGQPDGVEGFGGADLDDAVFQMVATSMGGFGELDPNDPMVLRAVTDLRTSCREAKEALSTETSTSVLAMLPGRNAEEIRLTRSELEQLVRPRLAETVAALERSVSSAGIGLDDLDRILLVGGASRMPLVGEIVADGVGAPVAIDTHPKHAIALGAARHAIRQAAVPAAPAPPPRSGPLVPEPELPPTQPMEPPPPPLPVDREPVRSETPARAGAFGRVVVPLLLLAALVVAVALVANNRFGGGDGDGTEVAILQGSGDGETTTTTESEESTPASIGVSEADEYRNEVAQVWSQNEALTLFLAGAPPLSGNVPNPLPAFSCLTELQEVELLFGEGGSNLDSRILALPSHADLPDGIDTTVLPDLQQSYETFRTEVLAFYVDCNDAAPAAPDIQGHPWFDAFVQVQTDLCVLGAIGNIEIDGEIVLCGAVEDPDALATQLADLLRPE
ncbi:MAG: Hsp70 family protein [Actinomycetota bacterium]